MSGHCSPALLPQTSRNPIAPQPEWKGSLSGPQPMCGTQFSVKNSQKLIKITTGTFCRFQWTEMGPRGGRPGGLGDGLGGFLCQQRKQKSISQSVKVPMPSFSIPLFFSLWLQHYDTQGTDGPQKKTQPKLGRPRLQREGPRVSQAHTRQRSGRLAAKEAGRRR